MSSLEVQQGSAWTAIPRADYNYFVADQGLGTGPFALRTTDDRGQQIVDDNVMLGDGVVRAGSAQFAACN